jgi:hypothetical protein
VFGLIILNPLKFDWQQRISLFVAVSAFAYFLAHTVHKPKVSTSTPLAPDPRVVVLEQQVKDLQSKQQQLLAGQAESEKDRKKKEEIRKHLSDLITQGVQLRNDWQAHLGQSEEIQKQNALAVQRWHIQVESYLKSIPRGDVYVARFRGSTRTSGSYPVGINLNWAGAWDSLMSDLAMLNQFITDADLGKP